MKFPPIFFHQLSKLFLFLFFFSFSSCQSQSDKSSSNPYPFKMMEYFDVKSEITDKIYIPYLKDGKYGLSDYDGNVILESQFERLIKMNNSFPYIWAGNKTMTLHDLKGNEILDYRGNPIVRTRTEWETILRINKNGIAKNYSLLKVREMDPTTLPINKIKGKELVKDKGSDRGPQYRYFYIGEKTKPPFLPYFHPEYAHLPKGIPFKSKEKPLNNQYIKVMTEEGLFTFLDKNGNPVVEPNWHCKIIDEGKVAIYKNKRESILKDFENGGQTKTQYHELKKTKSKHIVSGERREENAKIRSAIGNTGREIEFEGNEGFFVVNEKYSVFAKDIYDIKASATIWDNEKFEPIRDIPTSKIYKLYNDVGFDIDDSENPTYFTNLDGERFPVPKNYVAGFINESTYCFKDDKSYGLAKIDGTEIVRLENTSIDYRGEKLFRIRNFETKKTGLINIEGEIILPAKYDEIHFRHGDIIIAKTSGTDEIYSKEGERLFPFLKGEISSPGSVGFRKGFEIKDENSFYVLTSDLKIIREDNKVNPIINKSMFQIDNNSSEINEDFASAKMPYYYSNYAIFSGEKFAHVFKIDGKYLASYPGVLSTELERFFDENSKLEDLDRLTGLIEMENNGEYYWVRLKDGMKYVEE